jgi:aminoglycoside/choline kinase family phosphotransferase
VSREIAGDARLELLRGWLVETLGFANARIEPASADASFRRYFRVTRGEESYIVMDAPPGKEDLAPYLGVTRMLADLDLSVPWVLARNVADGLLLLTDLGTRSYLDELREGSAVDALYADAMRALARLQTAGGAYADSLPRYDRALLRREMNLLPEWFLARHLELPPEPRIEALLGRTFSALEDAALAQPQSFVHRDYHSRNLMVLGAGNPGIIDFQDAVAGPLTYDLVSLLKDCYIAWPAARVREWALGHRERLRTAGIGAGADAAEFLRWFDLMGLQRHIKVLGIFSRLWYRDGKSRYLGDLPRVLDYAESAAANYPETEDFARFLAEEVRPRLDAAQARVPA